MYRILILREALCSISWQGSWMCNRYFARSCRILCMINLHCHMIDMYTHTHEHTHIHTQAHQHAWTCMQTHSLFSTHSHTHAQRVCISECAFVLICTMCMNTHAWTIHEYIHVTQSCTSRSSFLPYTLFPPLLISQLSPPFSLPSLLSSYPSLSPPFSFLSYSPPLIPLPSSLSSPLLSPLLSPFGST